MSTKNIYKSQLNVTIDKTVVELLRDFHATSGQTLAQSVSEAIVDYIEKKTAGQGQKLTAFRTSREDELLKDVSDFKASIGQD